MHLPIIELLNSFSPFSRFSRFSVALVHQVRQLGAVDPRALVVQFLGSVSAAFAQLAVSVGQVVLPFAFVFGPVEQALHVLGVVGAEQGDWAAPDACACALAKPVKVSLVEASVAHFRAFCV